MKNRMDINERINIEYQFTAIPTNLMACLDINCRSMLFTLIQLGSYYADSEGWLFRTNEDLRAESQLSENLVRATLSTLYNIGIVDVQTVGKGKSKTPNKFKLNIERFKDWEKYSLEDCIKHPDLHIETDDYKAKGWKPSYLHQLESKTNKDIRDIPTLLPKPQQSEDNIENTDNKDNKLSNDSKEVEIKTSSFEEYKKTEDDLMRKLFNVSTLDDFSLYRQQIDDLIQTASSQKVAERTCKRLEKIEKGKKRYLCNKAQRESKGRRQIDLTQDHVNKEINNSDFLTIDIHSNHNTESDKDAEIVTRETLAQYGIDVPNDREANNPDNITRVPTPYEIEMEDMLPF